MWYFFINKARIAPVNQAKTSNHVSIPPVKRGRFSRRHRILSKKIVLLLATLFISCAGGGKYLSYTGIGAENYKSAAHYIFENDFIILAAQIRSGGILNLFWYDFLVVNNGKSPLILNWVYDVLFLEYQGKTFQLNKITGVMDYPSHLNPDSEVKIAFSIERRFNNSINNIDRLKFQFNDEIFILDKNPDANWQ